jgi:hypothetical protein
MTEYTWNQILALAGIYEGDSPMERDLKFSYWIKGRKYRIVASVRYAQEREWAIDDAVEILIIKE